MRKGTGENLEIHDGREAIVQGCALSRTLSRKRGLVSASKKGKHAGMQCASMHHADTRAKGIGIRKRVSGDSEDSFFAGEFGTCSFGLNQV